MKNHNTSKLILALGILLSMYACDPGHHGIATIDNATTYTLKLKYTQSGRDTTIFINPNTILNLGQFGGIGTGNGFHCCPCEWNQIQLEAVDTGKHITKAITDEANWGLNNPNHRNFSNKNITCEFILTANDIH